MAQIKNFMFNCTLRPVKQGTSAYSEDLAKDWKRISLPVTDGTSTVFIELFGMKYDTIKTMIEVDENGRKTYKTIEVKWDDRKKPSLLDDVAAFRKFVLDVNDVRQEFIHEYDYIVAVNEAYQKGLLNDRNLYIRGNIVFSEYQGKVQQRFVPNFIGYSKSNDLSLMGEMSFVFDENSLDFESGKDKYQLYLDAWVLDYNKEIKGNGFFKQTFVYDYSNLPGLTDEELERGKRQLASVRKLFSVKSGYHEFGFVVKFINGAETKDFDLDDCTEFELEMLNDGQITLEDLKKVKGLKQEYKREIRLVRPLIGRYATGVVERDELTDADFGRGNQHVDTLIDDLDLPF